MVQAKDQETCLFSTIFKKTGKNANHSRKTGSSQAIQDRPPYQNCLLHNLTYKTTLKKHRPIRHSQRKGLPNLGALIIPVTGRLGTNAWLIRLFNS
jgi:hypothetical protein